MEERIEEILKECDDTFFEYEDNLVELIYQFIINNKESFLKIVHLINFQKQIYFPLQIKQ